MSIMAFSRSISAVEHLAKLNSMLAFGEPKSNPCKLDWCNIRRDLNFREELRNGKEKVSNAKRGLCLDCFQREGNLLSRKTAALAMWDSFWAKPYEGLEDSGTQTARTCFLFGELSGE
jgi:hypothetical protein